MQTPCGGPQLREACSAALGSRQSCPRLNANADLVFNSAPPKFGHFTCKKRMPNMDHLVEPPFQLPASESSAGSELDMALCRLDWRHTPKGPGELLGAWTAERELTDRVF